MNRFSSGLRIISFSILIISSTLTAQWFQQSNFNNPVQTLQIIRFYDNNTGYTSSSLFNGSNNCIYKTTNGGVNWTAQNSNFTSWRFMGICILSPDTVFISGNGGVIIRTYNGGVNWTTLTTGNTDQLWDITFRSSLVGYSCGSAGRIIKTTDGGNTWSNCTSNTPYQLWSMSFVNDSVAYVCGSSLVYKTTNYGVSWFNTGFTGLPPGDFEYQTIFQNVNTGYVASSIGRVWKTTNGGVNWGTLTTNTTEQLFGMKFTDVNTGYICGDHGLIMKTTDAGGSWTQQASGLNEFLFAMDFKSRDTGYICSYSGKVLKTTNGGLTFIAPISNELPASYSLEQNYPNPFNPETRIKFDVPSPLSFGEWQGVRLSIYDALGKEVTVLVNEQLAPGKYEVNWNASNVPSGIYFYTLRSGEYTQTRKMILLK